MLKLVFLNWQQISLAKLTYFHFIAAWLVAILQVWFYYPFLGLSTRHLVFHGDAVALTGMWLLLCLLLLSPSLFLSLLLFKLKWKRLSGALAWLMSFGVLFSFCADTAAVRASGNHIMYHIPFLTDILTGYGMAGFDLIGGFSTILLQVTMQALFAILLLTCSSFVASRLARVFQQRGKVASFSPVVLSFAFIAVSQVLWSDVVTPIYSGRYLPVQIPLFEEATVSWSSRGVRIVGFQRTSASDDTVFIRNFGPDVSLEGWKLVGKTGETLLSGQLAHKGDLEVLLELDGKRDALRLLDGQGRQRDLLQYSPASIRMASEVLLRTGEDIHFAESSKRLENSLSNSLASPTPIFPKLKFPTRPHVVLLVVESWSPDGFNPTDMPLLWERSNNGIRLENHYSGSNTTMLGVYSVMYGRTSIFYRHDLAQGLPPPMSSMLRAVGYNAFYRSPTDWQHWRWMGRIINSDTFDDMKDLNMGDWPRADIAILNEFIKLTNTSREPVFLSCKLMSPHFPYHFLKQFDKHKPSLAESNDQAVLRKADKTILENRYKNTMATLDFAFDKFLEQVPLDRTIVIIVGDHGESLWDDGTLAHGTLSSRIQMATPCIIVGKNVPSMSIQRVTSSSDLVPTLCHLLMGKEVDLSDFCHGESVMVKSTRKTVPLTPLSRMGNYQLVFTDGTQQLQFNLRSRAWLSGQSNLGPNNSDIEVTFAGVLDNNGRIKRNLEQGFPFERWAAELNYWTQKFEEASPGR